MKNMYSHLIIMASAYSIGKRIALHYVNEDEKAHLEYKELTLACGKDSSIATHFICTDSPTWNSIVQHDAFFKNVLVIKTKEEFISLVQKDKKLDALDVAKYITSRVRCTHLKLEKLVYMCYADYLCETGKKLFDDEIYAYRYGPIIKSVYQKYRRTKKAIEDNRSKYGDAKKELPIRSRIIISENGMNKLSSIEKTLTNYGKFTAFELVSITHRKDTPWNMAGAGKEVNRLISDDLIKKYHINESILKD